MKKKQKVDIIYGLGILLVAIIILLLPAFEYTNVNNLLIIVYSIYLVLNLIRFILNLDSKDYEGLHNSLASLAMIVFTIIRKPSTPRELAILLFTWAMLMSLAKLKKVDYYHDRHDRMWKLKAFTLGIYILSGLLTSINLAFSSSVQIIVIGFFMLIHSILELFDPLIKTLIAHS